MLSPLYHSAFWNCFAISLIAFLPSSDSVSKGLRQSPISMTSHSKKYFSDANTPYLIS